MSCRSRLNESQWCEASRTSCTSIGSPSALQLLSNFLLHFVEFGNTSVNAHSLALIQVSFCVSRANAFGMTRPSHNVSKFDINVSFTDWTILLKKSVTVSSLYRECQ